VLAEERPVFSPHFMTRWIYKMTIHTTHSAGVSAQNLSICVADVINSRSISANDVDNFRLRIFKDGILTQKQAATLVALEIACPKSSLEWRDYYVTSLADFVLCWCEPYGGISEANTDWLKRLITQNGLVRTSNEFSLLKSILERAVPADTSFCVLVLEQLHHAMMDFPKNGKTMTDSYEDFEPSQHSNSIDVLERLNESSMFV
jgi:hypothetical protein